MGNSSHGKGVTDGQVGSSIQVALFVIPVIQLLAWTIGKPMT
jgi:Ca2+/H+ antiporter